MKKFLVAAASFAGLAFAAPSSATVVPFGVQTNVAVGTVTGAWGWTQCYSSLYGSSGQALTSILSACQGDNLMMAARQVGSNTFTVLAAADRADVIFNTGDFNNNTHNANGAEWYFSDSWSWGFAGGGDTVNRNSCDINGLGEADRLCWHTGGGTINGGWRAGTATSLNGSTDWERFLFVSNDAEEVPEPAMLGLFGLGALALAGARRRRG